MRLVIVAVLCACSSTYDPLDDVEYREYPDTASAVRAILADTGPARVYAIGEYHPTQQMVERHSPLARFTYEIMPLLANANHLVVEAWFDPSCASNADPVQSQIQAVAKRPPSQYADVANLVAAARMQAHGLAVTCIEHSSMLDPQGRVDFFRLLALVADKLHDTTRTLVDAGRDVIVYGGALHNELYPRWQLDRLAYAHTLARDVEVLELDLAVPEIVAPMKVLWREDWFPLLARSSPDRVMVWERGPGSYVLVLPAESTAKLAQADR
jgi:hypothetical protein